MKTFIAYFRVSTNRQGESGLGLEAQAIAVREFVKTQGNLIAEYTEIESGKRADRPQLANAIAHARRINATLIIAKLDRLARNVHFLSTLMNNGTDFIAVDNPSANRLTVQILAAVAEDEVLRISSRTKAALQAYKSRGGKLGAQNPRCKQLSPSDAKKGQIAGARMSAHKANLAYEDLAPEIRRLHIEGQSLRKIAEYLNAMGHTTRAMKKWSAVQVQRILKRLAEPQNFRINGSKYF